MQEEKHKRCFKCRETKPLSDFYKHPMMADGHLNKCKECNKKDVRENRAVKNDYYTEYDQKRESDPVRHRKKLEYSKKYTKENFVKRKAQSAIGNAIRDGRMVRGMHCECCGSTTNVHGHHSSYSEDMWLLVTWLCSRCHIRLHKDFEYKLGPWSDLI